MSIFVIVALYRVIEQRPCASLLSREFHGWVMQLDPVTSSQSAGDSNDEATSPPRNYSIGTKVLPCFQNTLVGTNSGSQPHLMQIYMDSAPRGYPH